MAQILLWPLRDFMKQTPCWQYTMNSYHNCSAVPDGTHSIAMLTSRHVPATELACGLEYVGCSFAKAASVGVSARSILRCGLFTTAYIYIYKLGLGFCQPVTFYQEALGKLRYLSKAISAAGTPCCRPHSCRGPKNDYHVFQHIALRPKNGLRTGLSKVKPKDPPLQPRNTCRSQTLHGASSLDPQMTQKVVDELCLTSM